MSLRNWLQYSVYNRKAWIITWVLEVSSWSFWTNRAKWTRTNWVKIPRRIVKTSNKTRARYLRIAWFKSHRRLENTIKWIRVMLPIRISWASETTTHTKMARVARKIDISRKVLPQATLHRQYKSTIHLLRRTSSLTTNISHLAASNSLNRFIQIFRESKTSKMICPSNISNRQTFWSRCSNRILWRSFSLTKYRST